MGSASAANVMMMMNNLVAHHSKPLSLLPSHFPTSHKPIVAWRGIPRHHLTCPSQPLTLHCDKNCSAQVFEETQVSKHVFHGTKDPMEEILESLYKNSRPCLIVLVPFLDDAKKAFAIGGEYGLIEGRSASLIHPIVMGVLFVFTLWTGYLGWQWRRVRTIQDEITQLKKQVKPQPVAAGEGSSSPPPPPSPIEAQIQQLTEERKQLLKGSYREKHFNAGSILLAFGVFEAIGGCLNTYLRTGKLFTGPHLFAGAGITVLWAWAAALVPAMQKGNETARSLHIALNAINVLLFIWQIPTGFEIVLKVFEFTKWP